MEDIKIKINKETREVNPRQIFIGTDGENLQGNVIFSFENNFVDGQARLDVEFRDGTKGQITELEKVNETYVMPIKSEITKYSGCKAQLVITEGTNENNIPIFKSLYVRLIVEESINASTPIPEEYAEWIDSANVKLNQMDNLNIEASKVDDTTTITITRKDGIQETTDVDDGIDGIGLNYNWNGTSLGIKREDEQNYDYVNLKGDKGEPGAIKMIIVNELPATGQDDTIYLVPLSTPESQENNYAEYVYINNAWELLGKIGIQVDLTDYYTKQEVNALIPNELSDLQDDSTHRLVTDTEKSTWDAKLDNDDLTNYVKNTDYATSSVGGVIKSGWGVGQYMDNGVLQARTITYQEYQSAGNSFFIGKGTLENVITGKDLTTKAYVDGLVGDISNAIDLINGESV